ncbi:ribonuclease HII [Steroidobacter denitrificans]|uniref:Ribonuclease HII n=1 Tax=Steroidobacter denitrificans TaxID=465721 RepID=A0A127FAA4_STEDE|nr:ribonuclease HII [Steroidobacter denitrificans]AMN47347.1 ribonuclease HII [Steroidobacter denitrificans]
MNSQWALDRAREGLLAGVDEAGRGPLAGPVVAAAVILDPRRRIRGIRDSKQLGEQARRHLAGKIRSVALAWSVAWADVEEIDTLNILEATHLAMRRALLGLRVRPAHVKVDGNRCPSFAGLALGCSFEAIVGGDRLEQCISAASILAKSTRDHMMTALDTIYPHYGLAKHKGYGTAMHYRALARWGASPIHRRSFAPVRLALEGRPASWPGA